MAREPTFTGFTGVATFTMRSTPMAAAPSQAARLSAGPAICANASAESAR
jgi:hypothetical protein